MSPSLGTSPCLFTSRRSCNVFHAQIEHVNAVPRFPHSESPLRSLPSLVENPCSPKCPLSLFPCLLLRMCIASTRIQSNPLLLTADLPIHTIFQSTMIFSLLWMFSVNGGSLSLRAAFGPSFGERDSKDCDECGIAWKMAQWRDELRTNERTSHESPFPHSSSCMNYTYY